MSALSDFNQQSIIARGQFAVVWLCARRKDGKQFVLKRIAVSDARLLLEAASAANRLCKLNHPNIVKYRKCFVDDRDVCLISELCSCGSMADRIATMGHHRFTEEQLRGWTLDLCLALHYIHVRDVVHGNIKPSNIFFTAKNAIKIGDFGIFRGLNPNGTTQMFTDGPVYCSPEILSGGIYYSKTDIWSLGCCLYEMMTFQPAIDAQRATKNGFKLAGSTPRDYSSAFTELVGQMLKSKAQRRPTVEQLLRSSTMISCLCSRQNALTTSTPFTGITVTIRQGDPVDGQHLQVDALVSPTSGKLTSNAGIAKSIAKAAGEDLRRECKNYAQMNGCLQCPEVMHTTAGRLQPAVRYVIHAACPQAKQCPEDGELREAQRATFYNCLAYANDVLKAASVAIPEIGYDGSFDVPASVVSEEAYNAVAMFDKHLSTSGDGCNRLLKEIRFVCNRSDTTLAFVMAFSAALKR